jgi:coenzyme F420 hydrogenase subunit beta
MAAKEMYAEPTYLECGFGELDYKVIQQDICCLCGNCIALCPKIAKKENRPALVEYDPLCGVCYAFCPRTFLNVPEMEKKLFGRQGRPDETLGIYEKAAAARATPMKGAAQDGGVVTALLIQALESGMIDCAVVTGRNSRWQSGPRLATTPEQVIAAAGTKYTITPSVIGIKMAIDEGYSKIGFTGTPCQIQALRKLQLLDEPYELGQEKIALLIGLFCMENFGHDDLMKGLVDQTFGLQPTDVDRFEIKKGMFRVVSKGQAKEVPLAQTDAFTWKGCGPCFDFAAELADISVGSVGSPEGWSTVLTRTAAGAEVFDRALKSKAIESKDVSAKGLDLVKKLASGKVDRFEKNAKRIRDAGRRFDVVRE